MEIERVVNLRKQAENAVADMADSELKTKAFQVVFEYLLNDADGLANALDAPTPDSGTHAKSASDEAKSSPTSCIDRIRLLKAQGFFRAQIGLSDVRDELASKGWHYPITSLSGPLQVLVQRNELHRMKAKEGGKVVWKYSLP